MRQRIITAILAVCAYTTQAQITVEAEAATLVGTEVKTEGSVSYVTGLDNDGDMFTNTVTMSEAGFYTIAMTYKGGDAKVQSLLVNGGVYADISFPASPSWSTVTLNSVYFKAGSNTFSIKKNWGYNDFDKFVLTKQAVIPHDYSSVDQNPINANATVEAKELYSFLLQNYGKYIISGQTNDYYDKIVDLTKKHPIMRTFDMQSYCNHYPYGWNNEKATFDWRTCKDDGTVQKAIDWYMSTNKKGIVAMQWHWCSPTGGEVGKNTFYVANTKFDITKAITPGTDEYKATINDIDSVAKYLKRFKDAGVPVLWRPLHEAGGAWFWWGAKGATACKALWDTVYNRMVNKYELNNLIWVWSTPEKDWYLGNDKLDILGFDSYPGSYQYTAQKPMFEQLYEMCDGKKMVTLSENGPIPNPQDCMDMDARWSYFMSWDNLVFEQNSIDHIKDVFVHPKVLSIEDLDKLIEDKPSVVFRAPDDGTYYVEGASVPVTAVPFSPNSEIDSVRFLVDNVYKSKTTDLPYAKYQFEGLSVGSHTIRAHAYDKDLKLAEAICTVNVVALKDIVLKLTPLEASILPSGSQLFTVSVKNKDGKVCEGANLVWTVTGGGTITKLSDGSAKFTPNAASGTFTVTAAQGVASVSTSVEISDCPTTKLPLAANWITSNGWNDQTNGSVPVQGEDALIIKARKWGKTDLLAVQSGSKMSFVKDSMYAVSFDFLNDATYPVASFNMSFATAWNNQAVTTAITQTENITAPTGTTFSHITKTFVATQSGEAALAIALTWSAQPNDTARLKIKNIQICQQVKQTAVPVNKLNTLSIQPNPANNFVSIKASAALVAGTIWAINESGHRVMLFADTLNDESISLYVGDLAAGAYTIEIPTIAGLLSEKLFIVR